MRSFALLSTLAFALVHVASVRADEAPELNVITTFPNNPFSIVHNGQANRVVFTISKPSKLDRALTLESISGAFLNPKKPDGVKSRVVRNMTTQPLKSLPLSSVGGQPLQVPFDFWSEFRPQLLGVEFRFNVRDQSESKAYNILAYRGFVIVQEPPQSLFDLQLLSVYAVIAAFAAGVLYIVYKTYVPERTPAPRAPRASAPAPKVQEKGKGKSKSASYDEEWIPQEILRTRKQRARK